jgi:hypothetical protein
MIHILKCLYIYQHINYKYIFYKIKMYKDGLYIYRHINLKEQSKYKKLER